jgi:hypothetical protein
VVGREQRRRLLPLVRPVAAAGRRRQREEQREASSPDTHPTSIRDDRAPDAARRGHGGGAGCLWDDDSIPERLENDDGSAIETAVKLRADVVIRPLHALADGVDGSNGVFVFGAGFPDVSTFTATNYWVDVVFDD